ncbi:MAG: chromosome segregation protein SMC, partial [Pseudomonadota bacterium]
VSDDNVIGDLRVLIENEKRALATEEEVLTEQQERVENDQLIERETEKDVSDSRNALFRENTRLESLLALQSESTNQTQYPDWIEKDNLISIWQAFSVDMAYSKCLETVLQLFDHVQVYKGKKPLVEQWQAGPSISLWIQDMFAEEKVPESLAYYLKQPKVPQIFNHIIITDNLEIASQHASETSHLSYIDKDGNWLAKSMMLRPKTSKGKLERADEIRKAEANIQTLKAEIGAKEAELASLSEALRNQKSTLAAQKTKLEGVKKVLGERETNLKFAELQAAQQKEQQVKILNELEKQRLIMGEESESLDLLNFQIEELSITVADGEDEKRQRESTTVQLKAELQVLADKMSATQSDLHQHQLQLQQIKNSLQLANEQQKAKHHMLTSFQEKMSLLEEEAENLSLPASEQQEKLQELLQQKHVLSDEQKDISVKTNEVEHDIKQLEQGSSSVNIQIEKLKSNIEGERLKAESAKVRAQGFLEQLAEMNVQLNAYVDTMPDDQDESELQQSLDKVTASIQRLGAVNLAAVDEFAEQSERKSHLDAQNDDLVAALETLENAMRKIDRETKMRFKTTFDKVNNDLKGLFPKVFGGGSAYLALTEDDLLDTGVTIMARPPGKKNSTIQLLSGGEKALTALSLVFAIFRLNPSPFCLLDEVDAPLDDANVGRFCKLVMEMSKTVQFIYITHNKVAMEMASHLTGVTMAEPGVSRMVSVNMEEALEIAE